MNFENNSTWSYWGDNLGDAAADELVTQLFGTGKFSLVERSQLEAVLAEQNLGQSGRVNSAQAAEIGRIPRRADDSDRVDHKVSLSTPRAAGLGDSARNTPRQRAISTSASSIPIRRRSCLPTRVREGSSWWSSGQRDEFSAGV